MARSWTTAAPSPDDAVAQAAIEERLRVARALRDQSMQGASLENVGGQLVGNPIARALSSGLQGFSAGRQEQRALGDAQALAGQQRERLAAALAGAGQQRSPDDMIAFGTRLMNDPATSEVGQFYIQAGQRAKQEAERTAREEARWGRQDAEAQRRFTESEARAARQHQERMAQDAAQAKAALDAAAAKSAGGADPYKTTIPTQKYGVLPYDNRTGQIELPGIGWVSTKDLPQIEKDHPELQKYLVRPQDDPTNRGEIKSAEQMAVANAKYWASRPAAKAMRDALITDIKRLKEAPGLRDIFGAIGGRIPDVLPAARDARALLNKVVGGMTAENRDKLVGQGSVSDYEGRLMERASTILSDTSISDDLAVEEVGKILTDLEQGTYAPTEPTMPGAAAPAAPAGPSDDDLVNKYLNGQP